MVISRSEAGAERDGAIVEEALPPQEVLFDWRESWKELESRFGLESDECAIFVSVSDQTLYLIRDEGIVRTYPVSTSKYGIGNREGSKKTPVGTHRISKKIGRGVRFGTIFESRMNTGRVAAIYRDSTDTEEDLIATRILWLEGLVPGINRGHGVDSYERRIYIHGTHEEGLIGTPASNGCIRMRNRDVAELFDLVRKGTLVEIQPEFRDDRSASGGS